MKPGTRFGRMIWVLAAAVWTAPAQSGKFDKAEAETLVKLQEIWTGTATKAAAGNHDLLLRLALDEARDAGAKGDAIDNVESKYMAPRNYAVAKDGPESGELLRSAKAAAASAVDPLLALDPPESAATRFARHLQRFLEADGKNAKRIQLHQKRAAAALGKKDWDTLRLLVMRAAELDPDGYKGGKYAPAETALARNGGIVVRGRDHIMQAYVVLPDGWTAKKTWPLFVAIVGANCAYQSLLEELTRAASKKPAVLVIPMTISNANELPFQKLPYARETMTPYADLGRRPQRLMWDEQGLASVLSEVRSRFGGEERFFLTGYSGGGMLTYFWLQHHAGQLFGACLASANYWDFCEQGTVPPVDGGCPVLIVSGTLDSAGKERIFPQSDQGTARLKSLGFTQVERRHLTGRDHEAFYELGFEVFENARKAAKKKP